VKVVSWIKGLFTKKINYEQPRIPQDPFAPRRKNRIYPNDEFAKDHINRWLDDVLDKHHG